MGGLLKKIENYDFFIYILTLITFFVAIYLKKFNLIYTLPFFTFIYWNTDKKFKMEYGLFYFIIASSFIGFPWFIFLVLQNYISNLICLFYLLLFFPLLNSYTYKYFKIWSYKDENENLINGENTYWNSR